MPEFKTLEFTLTGNNGAPGTVEVQISDTYSAVNNTSTLQVSRVRFKRDNFSGVSTAIDGQILINGNAVATFSNVFITSSASYVTVSPTSTSSLSVLHNNDGSLSVSVMLIKNGSAYQGFTAFMTAYTAYTIWSNESKTLALTTQPRESSISSCTANVTTQGTIALTMNRKMDSATHIATITSGGVTLYTSSSFAASINITAARTWFASFPSATSITATVSVQTYLSGTAIGSPQTATVVVAADDGMKPTVASGWVSMSRVQATAAASIAAYVKGYSSARFSFDTSKITMASGATISSYSVVYGGITKSGAGTITTDKILNTGSVTFTVYVTDSRGRYASSTFTVTVYDYSSPTLTGISVFRAQSDGTAKDDGTYISLTATANISSVNSLNSYTLTAAYKALNGSYGSETAMTSGTALIIGGGLIAANASYSARITLTDALGNTATFEQVIPTAEVAFNIRKGGGGAAFGKYAEANDELQLPADWRIKIGNNYLIDIIYPVGSIYLSVNSASPQTLFGGTWERIKDKFLLSAGDTYSAGATGGEATHVLTTYEMPRHTHDQYNWLFNGAQATGTHYGLGWQENTGGMFGMSSDWAYNGQTGDGAAHNNMPPYLAVYIWKRTA